MTRLLAEWPLTGFVLLTFGSSIAFGLVAFRLGGEATFESASALPFLLLTIWAPTLAALAVSASEGTLRTLLSSVFRQAGMTAWALALVPFLVGCVLAFLQGWGEPVGFKTWVLLLAMNLVMGPLGEELGWRGFLLPRLLSRMGPVTAALCVGVVWALWHLPLWALPSPHRQIPFFVFFLTVVSFSFIMSTAYLWGGRALLPCVLFHLLANVGVGWLEISGTMSAREAYTRGLPLYATLAFLAILLLNRQPPQTD